MNPGSSLRVKTISVIAIVSLMSVALSYTQVTNQSSQGSLDPVLYQKLDAIQKQHMALAAAMQQASDKINTLHPVIITNTEHLKQLDRRVSTIEDRLIHHEESGAKEPVSIAVLETKVDGIARVGAWILATVGTMFVAWIVAAVKRAIDKGPPVWAKQAAEEQAEYRKTVITELAEVKTAADLAYKTANRVNQRLHALGLKTPDEPKE